MNADYTRWRRRLAGDPVTSFTEPDEGDSGFYRLPIREKQPNGRWKVLAWKPVALFVSPDGVLDCQIGGRVVRKDEYNEQWPWFVKHPISEEVWRAVAERGEPWPDAKDDQEIVPASNREVTGADNAAPEQPLDVQHATAVDNAISAALTKVTSETEASQALGSKNRIAELRLAADKAGKVIYEPIYRQYTAEQKKWSPIIARATAKEKDLNTAILTFRESERKRIAAEQAAAEAKQREIDEANARMADRAIARGEPEPEPIFEEVLIPVAAAPIVATYGTRKLKEEVKTFLESVNDLDAVYTYFKDTTEVKAVLTTLATAAIRTGRTVPGTTTREGLI